MSAVSDAQATDADVEQDDEIQRLTGMRNGDENNEKNEMMLKVTDDDDDDDDDDGAGGDGGDDDGDAGGGDRDDKSTHNADACGSGSMHAQVVCVRVIQIIQLQVLGV